MRRTAYEWKPPPGPWRSCGLPLLLSLGVHGGLVLALHLVPAGEDADERPLPIDTVVWADSAITLGLDVPRPLPREPAAPSPLAISVSELPVSGPPATAPRTEASAAGAGSANGSGEPDAATGAAAGPAIFQVQGHGRSVVYVIDRSLSMGLNGTLTAARRELLASVARLPETVRFQVILYNRQAEPLRLDGRTELAPATARNKECAAAFVEGLRAEGSTDHLGALKRALSLQPEVIFFITDAADLTPPQVRAVTQQNQGRTCIHTIELSRLADRDNALSLLARSNRGTYRSVPPYSQGEPEALAPGALHGLTPPARP